jgi:Zn-finger nucleic acid-binding protein
MNSITFREWSIQLCPRCEGTYYEESVLLRLLQQPDLRMSYLRPALLSNLASPHTEEVDRAPIECPECCQTMAREAYSDTSKLLVERCTECQSIWLDDGELGELLREREQNQPLAEPGFIEALRRLLGLCPRTV